MNAPFQLDKYLKIIVSALFQIGKDAIAEGDTSETFHFSTRPTSKPSKLECKEESENELVFTWDEPHEIPYDLINNIDYIFELTKIGTINETCMFLIYRGSLMYAGSDYAVLNDMRFWINSRKI